MILNIKLYLLIILFGFIFFTTSCDYFNESPKKLTGKIYLWNMDGSDRKSLTIKTVDNFYSPVNISGTVTTALANDSLIYLKCDFQQYPAYHLINHEAGEKIINIKTIDSVDFLRFQQSKLFKYSYYSK